LFPWIPPKRWGPRVDTATWKHSIKGKHGSGWQSADMRCSGFHTWGGQTWAILT
jgi:hypothetical protein